MAGVRRAAWNVLGDTLVCTVSGRETGGTHAVFEHSSPPGGGTPPHVHRREDETFYVLEGQFEFVKEGRSIKAGPGTTIFAPRHVAHSFRNVGSAVGRMLLVATPSGIESFFEEMDREIGPPPPDMRKLLAILDRHGIELVEPSQA